MTEGQCAGRQVGSGPETLTSPAAAHEAEVVEARHLVLHHARGVPQFGRVVLVVARHHRHHRPVGYVTQGNHLSESQGGQEVQQISDYIKSVISSAMWPSVFTERQERNTLKPN